jgi:translation initiation factor 1
MDAKTRLVWSDDPRDKEKVAGKKAGRQPGKSAGQQAAGSPPAPLPGGDWTAVFRLEKGGRGGKTVTVIDRLPKHETFLKELCKELKAKCGAGGKFSAADGLIEIQGDQRETIKAIFGAKGIRFKGM